MQELTSDGEHKIHMLLDIYVLWKGVVFGKQLKKLELNHVEGYTDQFVSKLQ